MQNMSLLFLNNLFYVINLFRLPRKIKCYSVTFQKGRFVFCLFQRQIVITKFKRFVSEHSKTGNFVLFYYQGCIKQWSKRGGNVEKYPNKTALTFYIYPRI